MEIARHLVEEGLVAPEKLERAAEEIEKKLEELQEAKREAANKEIAKKLAGEG